MLGRLGKPIVQTAKKAIEGAEASGHLKLGGTVVEYTACVRTHHARVIKFDLYSLGVAVLVVAVVDFGARYPVAGILARATQVK